MPLSHVLEMFLVVGLLLIDLLVQSHIDDIAVVHFLPGVDGDLCPVELVVDFLLGNYAVRDFEGDIFPMEFVVVALVNWLLMRFVMYFHKC